MVRNDQILKTESEIIEFARMLENYRLKDYIDSWKVTKSPNEELTIFKVRVDGKNVNAAKSTLAPSIVKKIISDNKEML